MKTKILNVSQEKVVTDPTLIIEGGKRLYGEANISGAKNASLPAIVAACLTKDTVILKNVPVELNDVKLLIELLRSMGADITVDHGKNILRCSGRNWTGGHLNAEKSGKIRHSLLLLGLSASWKTPLFLPMPGGCDLGNRKHDMHVQLLRTLGNDIVEEEGLFIRPGTFENKVNIDFYYPTFGGTLNALFASVCSNEKTVIVNNAARNPEVIDVIDLLNKMGAKIKWLNSNTIIVEGVKELKGVNYSIMPDRIIAATVIAGTAITDGNVNIKNFNSNLLKAEIEVWTKAGIEFTQNNNNLNIKARNGINAVDITTRPFPGFHTDIQPLHTLMMALATGKSEIKETILDGRFKYCKQLAKMGADIEVEEGSFLCVNGAKGQIAKVKGVPQLYGNEVIATDIRGGAAVALGGMAAEGVTTITNIYQLERGYGKFVELFNGLGANIQRG